jgi:hypothetical protein
LALTAYRNTVRMLGAGIITVLPYNEERQSVVIQGSVAFVIGLSTGDFAGGGGFSVPANTRVEWNYSQHGAIVWGPILASILGTVFCVESIGGSNAGITMRSRAAAQNIIDAARRCGINLSGTR